MIESGVFLTQFGLSSCTKMIENVMWKIFGFQTFLENIELHCYSSFVLSYWDSLWERINSRHFVQFWHNFGILVAQTRLKWKKPVVSDHYLKNIHQTFCAALLRNFSEINWFWATLVKCHQAWWPIYKWQKIMSFSYYLKNMYIQILWNVSFLVL